MEPYGIHSDFDLECHKATFTNYLEVIIDASGKVMYAVPSHQEKLIAMACERLGVSRNELKGLCPGEYYGDFTRWLCLLTGAISVWNDWCEYGNPTTRQIGALRQLKMAGLYRGPIPNLPREPSDTNLENLLRSPEESREEPIKESILQALSAFLPTKREAP